MEKGNSTRIYWTFHRNKVDSSGMVFKRSLNEAVYFVPTQLAILL